MIYMKETLSFLAKKGIKTEVSKEHKVEAKETKGGVAYLKITKN